MTVTIYRWDDASAPTLTGNAADYKLIDVLDKCLVAGYGSKAAAGWTKAYTGTGKAAFKQGTGSNGFYLRVDCSSSSQTPRLRGYETMSNVDTGTGPFPTDAQVSGGLYAYVSSTSDTTQRPWLIAADAKRCYIYIGHDVATSAGLTSSAYKQMLFFGDIVSYKASDAYATLLIGSSSNTSGANYFGHIAGLTSAAGLGQYMARSYTQLGASVAAGKMSDYLRNNMVAAIGAGTGSAAYPDPVSGGIILQPILVHEPSAAVTRGYLPGVWAPLHNLPAAAGDTFSGAGAMSGKSFVLLDCATTTTRCRVALETSDTWG